MSMEGDDFAERLRNARDRSDEQLAPYIARVAEMYANLQGGETPLKEDFLSQATDQVIDVLEWLTLTIRDVSLAPQLATATLGKEEAASERWQISFERSDVDAASTFAPWWDGSMTVLPIRIGDVVRLRVDLGIRSGASEPGLIRVTARRGEEMWAVELTARYPEQFLPPLFPMNATKDDFTWTVEVGR